MGRVVSVLGYHHRFLQVILRVGLRTLRVVERDRYCKSKCHFDAERHPRLSFRIGSGEVS